jgi:hypothetical protein
MRIITLLIAILAFQSINGKTAKYRLMWFDSPESKITVGFEAIDGTAHRVYYDVVDNGTDTTKYANVKHVDATNSHRGMNNAFARVTGLQPNTKYYIVIADNNSVSKKYWFTTAPNSNKTRLSIIAGGDSRSNPEIRRDANKLAGKLKAHAICFGGDMTQGTSWNTNPDQDWQDWFTDWQLTFTPDGRITPLLVTRGNHEDAGDITKLYDAPTNEYYNTKFANGLLSVYTLNTEISIAGNQTTWLTNELQIDNSTWKMAQYHKPMRPHKGDKSEGVDQYNNWANLFYTNKVNLVVECDAHTVKTTKPLKPDASGDEGFSVDTTDGVVFIGEGCWGAPLRLNDDAKSWTVKSGKFNQFKWIWIDEGKMEALTIKVDNVNEVEEVDLNNRFFPPANLKIWDIDSKYSTVITSKTKESPKISITSPNQEQYYSSPQNIDITVNATDSDGNVSKVEFYANGKYIGEETSSPFSLNWAIPSQDLFNIQAIAIDNDGNHSLLSNKIIVMAGKFNKTTHYQISEAGDDAEEHQNGFTDIESSDIELTEDNTNPFSKKQQTIGLRFQNIEIPSNAIITNAYIQFTADGTDNGTCTMNFYGDDTDNSEIFLPQLNSVTSRAKTNASVNWTLLDWNNDNESGTRQQTPNLAPIIQEIISRPGWKNGNAISILGNGSGKRNSHSYDGTPSNAAKLYIDYSIGKEVFTKELVEITDFLIVPNPAKNFVNIELKQTTNAQILIYDLNGKLVLKQTLNQTTTKFDTTNWKKGVYIVSVNQNSNTKTKRLIIQ